MIYDIIERLDGTTVIQVDFVDEGVDLLGQTSVKGDEAAAVAYLPTFETDLRQNFAELFPIIEIPGGMEE